MKNYSPKNFNKREELSKRALAALDQHPEIKKQLDKPIEKFNKNTKTFVINKNSVLIQLNKNILKDLKGRGQFKEDQDLQSIDVESFLPRLKLKAKFSKRLKKVFSIGYKERPRTPLPVATPFIALSPLQRKIALMIMGNQRFKWRTISLACNLTLKELRVELSKIEGFLDRYYKNQNKTNKTISDDVLHREAQKIRNSDKWKYYNAVFILPPISRSKWYLNKKLLKTLGLSYKKFKGMSQEDFKILIQNKVTLTQDRIRKTNLKRARPLLRRHGIKIQTSPYSLDYGEALIRAEKLLIQRL